MIHPSGTFEYEAEFDQDSFRDSMSFYTEGIEAEMDRLETIEETAALIE